MSNASTLHITQGEAANELLSAAGLDGTILGWDDPLHHGPVPAGLNLEELTDVRAQFIAERGWGQLPQVRKRLIERNRLVGGHAGNGEVVIWSSFELVDQLQLAQLLDWFEQHSMVTEPPAVIWLSGHFSDQPREEIVRWFRERKPADEETLHQGSEVWQAFRAENPERLLRCRDRAIDRLPFMGPAILRLLQEYPGVDDGLSRTQREILSVLDESPQGPVTLFHRCQERESPPFMGEWSFWWEVEMLCTAPVPPLAVAGGGPFVAPPAVAPLARRFVDQQLELTPPGQRLLLGSADYVEQNGLDRWIGGVHLQRDNSRRWSGRDQTLR